MIILQIDPAVVSSFDTSYKTWDLIFTGIQAIGTVVVALLAIFGDKLIRQLFKPKLSIEINSLTPFVETIKEKEVFTSDENVYSRISIKVSNTGDSTAQNCQGIIETVFCKRKANESFYCYKSFIPTRLTWNDESKATFVTPNVPSYIEIARIQQIEELTTNNEMFGTVKSKNNTFDLYLSIEEPNEKGKYLKLGKGTFVIPIVIYTDNLRRTQKIFVEIYWNGKDTSTLTESDFYVKKLNQIDLPKELKQL